MFDFTQNLKNFRDNEDGVGTAWALSWVALCFAIAGLSVDITNAWKVKEFLQSTADVAALSGAQELGAPASQDLINRVAQSANEIATLNMRTDRFGDVLIDNDIEIGTWDEANKVFTPTPVGAVSIPTAVRVTTRQSGGASATVGTFFLRFAGFDEFRVATSATVERFMSACDMDGIISNDSVQFSTQEHIIGAYCVHGRNGVDLAQGSIFDPGAIVSMVDLADCGPSHTSCENAHNQGIEEALRQANMPTTKVAHIDEYIADLQNPLSDIQPKDYISATSTVHRIAARNFDPTTLISGDIYVVQCTGGSNLDMGVPAVSGNGNGNSGGGGAPAGPITKSDFVLVGLGCDFAFDDTIHYENAVFATTSTGNHSITGSSGVVLGRNDNCAPGGDVTIITDGSVYMASKLSAFDVEFIVRDDVHLASKANSGTIHQGTRVEAGGSVQVTTKHNFEGCNRSSSSGLDPKWSYRLVQ